MSFYNNYDFLGKPITERMHKSVPRQDPADLLTCVKELAPSSKSFGYEVVFTYEIQRPVGVNTFKTEEGNSFTCFRHDKELTEGEIKEMAIARIEENRFKGCRIIDLNICNVYKRF